MLARFYQNNLNEIPLANQTMSKYVPSVMSALVYLLCVVIAAVFAIGESLERWDMGVSNKLSVEIPVQHDLDRARVVPALTSYLKTVPGVKRVEVVDQGRIQELVSTLAGQPTIQLPLPAVVEVDIDPRTPLPITNLALDLRRFDPGVRVESHARWLDSIKGLRTALQAIALMFSGIIALAVVSIIMLVTNTGLATYEEIISTLRLIGAKNSYIAAKFQQNAFSLTSQGAIKGYVLAALTVLLLNNLSVFLGVPEYAIPSLSWLVFVYMALAPFFLLILSYSIARFAVLRNLATIQ